MEAGLERAPATCSAERARARHAAALRAPSAVAGNGGVLQRDAELLGKRGDPRQDVGQLLTLLLDRALASGLRQLADLLAQPGDGSTQPAGTITGGERAGDDVLEGGDLHARDSTVARMQQKQSWLARAARRARQMSNARAVTRSAGTPLPEELNFFTAPDHLAIRLAYNVLLGREPDDAGARDFARVLDGDPTKRGAMLDWVRGSEEFANRQFSTLGPSIHYGRGAFVRSLPPARRVLDLGGSSHTNAAGGLFGFGYPYEFDEMIVVDLPSDERHELYRDRDKASMEVPTHLGPVRYRYHSMVDLSGLDDESFDLVYSGQSIEHVTADEADVVLKEVARVLKPNGILALDTPNAAICRLQQGDFIDPDHKIEYTAAELDAKLAAAGFDVVERKGLNYAGASVEGGAFDAVDTARHWGLYAQPELCYLLAYVARHRG